MGNLHLVTGYAGEAHVTSSDQGSFNEALIRGGQFVLEAGANFSASIVTNNQVRVNDGELIMQGRHVKLSPGSYVDLSVENGAQGYFRTDLIVARYTRNTNSGIEECNLIVLKGIPDGSNPSAPEYITGNINSAGAIQHDFPLYRLTLSGLALEGIEAIFEPQRPIYDTMLHKSGGKMSGNIDMEGYKVTGLKNPSAASDAVNLGYMQKTTEKLLPKPATAKVEDLLRVSAIDSKGNVTQIEAVEVKKLTIGDLSYDGTQEIDATEQIRKLIGDAFANIGIAEEGAY